MAVIHFIRPDLRLRISAGANGEIVLRLTWGDTQRTETLSSLELFAAIAADGGTPAIDRILAPLDLRGAVDRWRGFTGPRIYGTREQTVYRMTLQLDEAALATLPWERHLGAIVGANPRDFTIVRASPVRARVAQLPLTLPLRLLQIDRSELDLGACIRACFHSVDDITLANSVGVQAGLAPDFTYHRAPADWPTVDVLHLGPTVIGKPDASSVLQTEDPFAVGTLGWMMRATEAWQTRLVVIETDTAEDESRARAVAAALCGRGGPAILVGPSRLSSPFYGAFYGALIHDNPIDQAFATALDHYVIGAIRQGRGDLSLFAGGGREELIRVSAPAQKLNDLAEALRSPDLQRGRDAAGELWSTIYAPGESLDSLSDKFQASIKGLETLRTSWPDLSFDISEGGGFIPSATQIDAIRRAIRPPAVAPSLSREVRPAAETQSRFANPSLSRRFDDGRSERLDPQTARIAPHDPLVLGIQIGPRDTFVPVIEAQALLEEPFKWQQGHKGVWLTIGVSGIDFDVLGHPAQQVWLPRSGATDVVEFSITPRRTGALLLRFCIYFGRMLLQSYRLAAWVGEEASDPQQIQHGLAGILGTTAEKVGGVRYLGRLEYAAAADLAESATDDNVALSIFANDIDGRRIVTVWTGEDLAVSSNQDISLIGQQIRSVLDDVSGGRYSDGERFYDFGGGRDGNAGDPDKFDIALRKLAVPGQQLYASILSKPLRRDLEARPVSPGSIIHVGQALLESVIPWAAVYDREYDADKTTHEGLAALHVTCSAGLSAGSALPAACGQHPDCPLSPGRLAQQRGNGQLASENTVVCPRHFWGFRHRIEIPPMQVEPGAKLPQRQTRIRAADPAALVIGFNASLKRAPLHLSEIEASLPTRSVKAIIRGQSSSRDGLLDLLKSRDIDLLYFFCHARGGQADPKIASPQLELQETGKEPGRIGWQQLDKFDWDHAPLVFLNGCNTAMFSPDALSPFIRTMMYCGAAGAVGTEIPVFEQLAATFAKALLGRLLNGEAAGQALLDTRLEFLQSKNPLGLAYTLYAFSDLAFAQAGS